LSHDFDFLENRPAEGNFCVPDHPGAIPPKWKSWSRRGIASAAADFKLKS